MLQEIYADAVAVFPLLLEATRFYFSSALLVFIALLIVLLHSLAALNSDHKLKVNLTWLVGFLRFFGRAVLALAMIVTAGTLAWGQTTDLNQWGDLLQNLAVSWEFEGVKMGVQLVMVGAVGTLLNFILERLVSEQGTAKLLHRMQRSWTPGTVRIILLLGISNLLFAPILLAAVLRIFHFI